MQGREADTWVALKNKLGAEMQRLVAAAEDQRRSLRAELKVPPAAATKGNGLPDDFNVERIDHNVGNPAE